MLQEKIEDRLPLITLFLEKNRQVNLSAIRTPEGVYKKHILDSLELLNVFPLHPQKTLLDVGTGGGFPLLPLAIRNPHVECVGIDARRKKVCAVNEIIQKLSLKNVKVLWVRSEEHTSTYDYVTVRAVAYVDVLFSLVHHLVKPFGYLILYKLFTQQEDALLQELAPKYHFELQKAHQYDLFGEEKQRVLYILQKVQHKSIGKLV